MSEPIVPNAALLALVTGGRAAPVREQVLAVVSRFTAAAPGAGDGLADVVDRECFAALAEALTAEFRIAVADTDFDGIKAVGGVVRLVINRM